MTQVELDQETVDLAGAEETQLLLQAQIQYLQQRVVQLNAINRKLAAQLDA
ncbi:hypothetical protein [Nocardioides nematodiphilus]|uniref:hypothetical protein n=1 Tax=Nocardioides nematodiphilus TaxID=2849669 RepID=UPI001CD9320D|nr:hypothetical protein [Nocardioides nematodiphilus]MCA1984787.1 hypothetical protein [Nocardioides nematodiphilus]